MIKKFAAIILSLALFLTACGQKAPTWQEQYDLGMRYLEEGNYEEAIIAFTAAIEIDPKQAPAYVGRGDAYVLSGETEENLAVAQADYEKAIELDETNADAYLGLADVHIRRGDYDKALEILRQGLEKCGDSQKLADKIEEMERGNIRDSLGNVRRESHFDKNGALNRVTDYRYNERGFKSGWTNTRYDTKSGEVTKVAYAVVEFGEDGYPSKNVYYSEDGTPNGTYDLMTFNDLGQEIERDKYYSDGTWRVFKYYYDESGRRTKYEVYKENGTKYGGYWEYLYDESGNAIGTNNYNAQGELTGTSYYS